MVNISWFKFVTNFIIVVCGDAVDLGIAKDTVNSLKSKLKKGLSCDMIVTIGGASIGDYEGVSKIHTCFDDAAGGGSAPGA